MKKFCLAGVAMFLGICCVFTGCKKDDEDIAESNPVSKITASSVQSKSAINAAVVKMVSTIPKGNVMAEGEYSGEKFTLNLPETIPAEELQVLGRPEGLKVSKSTANFGVVQTISGYDGTGKYVGDFIRGKAESEEASSQETYWYVDDDVTITGKEKYKEEGVSYTDSYNVNLKKGWNIVYITGGASSNTFTLTTAPKSGLIWIFVSSTGKSSASAANKTIGGIRPALPLFK